MSDFDKEAERERLREKYERDQEEREATERMSDLLLKGATMTNAHCQNCGDPIFRYQGDEFCPTCQRLVETGDGADDTDADAGDEGAEPDAGAADEAGSASGEDEPTASGADGSAPENIEVKQPTGPTVGDAGTDGEATPDEDGPGDDEADATAEPGTEEASTPSPRGTAESPSTPAPSGSSASAPDTSASTGTADGSGDALADARASLRRALVAHAQAAEGCEDPRRARDHLAAAREAAEALSALY